MKSIIRTIIRFVTHRLFILTMIICLAFTILFHQIFQLQIIQGEKLEKEFTLSVLREREIEGQRGNIYDRYGFPLAENVIAYKVLLDGSLIVDNKDRMLLKLTELIESNGDEVLQSFPIAKDTDGNYVFTQDQSSVQRLRRNLFIADSTDSLTKEEQDMTAEQIYKYVRDDLFQISNEEFTEEEILRILNIRYPLWLKRYAQYQLETIAINISNNTLAELEENISHFPGVTIVEDPLRQYNYAEYFAHIVGYTRKIDAESLIELEPLGYDANDIVGKIGIEKEMELYLAGEDGTQTLEVDNLGKTMKIIETTPPTAGKDVYLTIDKDLQIASYDILEQQLAYTLQERLSMVAYGEADDGATLMKDVFASLFRNEIINIDSIETATTKHQKNLYLVFMEEYNLITNHIKESLDKDLSYYNETYRGFYDYILSKLLLNGYLKEDYKNTDFYYDFINGTGSFKILLQEFIENDVIVFDNESLSSEEKYNKIKSIIIDEFFHYPSFKKEIYIQLATEEKFPYVNLCLALVEQGIVSATEKQIEDLENYRLGTVSFMKEKILSREITPQELALDPSSGSIVVTDVNTGEVLALVSYPSYDNNRLVNNFDYDYYSELLNDPTSPLFPRATQSKTAPGSTFKMVSAFAGLEEGIIQPSTYITSLGIFKKIFPPARCWIYNLGGTHGSITVAEALEESCNYFFYEVGYRLSLDQNGNYLDLKGIELLAKYASKFGLDQSTGIEIGDAGTDSVSNRDAVRTSIGQSTNNYTPVQLVRYVASVANGGTTFELNIIDKILNQTGELFFDKTPAIANQNNFAQENIEVVQKGMLLVTQGTSGTARNVFNNFPIQVAAKTGTAQENLRRPSHGIFVEYAPYEKPEIAVAVVIPFGYGSYVPTIIGRDIVAAYYEINEEKTSELFNHNHLLDE